MIENKCDLLIVEMTESKRDRLIVKMIENQCDLPMVEMVESQCDRTVVEMIENKCDRFTNNGECHWRQISFKQSQKLLSRPVQARVSWQILRLLNFFHQTSLSCPRLH